MEKLIELGWDTQAEIQDHSCCSVQEPSGCQPPRNLLVRLDNSRCFRWRDPRRGVLSILLPSTVFLTLNLVSRTGQGLDGMGCWVNSWLPVLYCVQCEGENNKKRKARKEKHVWRLQELNYTQWKSKCDKSNQKWWSPPQGKNIGRLGFFFS